MVPPATVGARPHIYWAHDEYFYVLVGELIVATEAREVALGVGDLAHDPRGSASFASSGIDRKAGSGGTSSRRGEHHRGVMHREAASQRVDGGADTG